MLHSTKEFTDSSHLPDSVNSQDGNVIKGEGQPEATAFWIHRCAIGKSISFSYLPTSAYLHATVRTRLTTLTSLGAVQSVAPAAAQHWRGLPHPSAGDHCARMLGGLRVRALGPVKPQQLPWSGLHRSVPLCVLWHQPSELLSIRKTSGFAGCP